jgi:hypothetical protein
MSESNDLHAQVSLRALPPSPSPSRAAPRLPDWQQLRQPAPPCPPQQKATTRQLSWLADLDAYNTRHAPAEPEDAQRRQLLLQALQEQPAAPEAWLALLAHEEAIAKALGAPDCPERAGVSLYHLYYWATQVVPRAKNQQREEYVRLWLGYARHQWCVCARPPPPCSPPAPARPSAPAAAPAGSATRTTRATPSRRCAARTSATASRRCTPSGRPWRPRRGTSARRWACCRRASGRGPSRWSGRRRLPPALPPPNLPALLDMRTRLAAAWSAASRRRVRRGGLAVWLAAAVHPPSISTQPRRPQADGAHAG